MDGQPPPGPQRWRSPLGVFMLAAGVLGLYYLLTEHLTHLAQAVPYVVLLACPLMHLLHGHGGHAHHRRGEPKDAGPAGS